MLHIYIYINIYIYIYDISNLRVNTSVHCSGRKQVNGKYMGWKRIYYKEIPEVLLVVSKGMGLEERGDKTKPM